MLRIDGKTVVGRGSLQFQHEAIADAGSAPPVCFRVVRTGPTDEVQESMEGNVLTLSLNLPVGALNAGFQNYTADGTQYVLAFVVHHLSDLPNGPFYDVRYTVALR
jgi:hypothetical protein